MPIRINDPYDEDHVELIDHARLCYRFKYGDTNMIITEDALYQRRTGFEVGVTEAARAFSALFTQKRIEREFDAESIRNMKPPEA